MKVEYAEEAERVFADTSVSITMQGKRHVGDAVSSMALGMS